MGWGLDMRMGADQQEWAEMSDQNLFYICMKPNDKWMRKVFKVR